ncbi:MAG: SDR family oxidoreductase [Promethearchaeota archaeon]
MELKTLFDMTGKTVLVTGGSGHLGQAMSNALAEFGATLFIASRNVAKNEKFARELTEKYHNPNYPLSLNITDGDSIQAARKLIMEGEGKIDVIINNAYSGAGSDILSMSLSDWKKGIDGTINSLFQITKEFLPFMIEQKKGKIINISSMYGIVAPDVSIYKNNPYYNPANYGTGKAGMIQFTRYIAAVYGKFGITSNSISPGPFPSKKIQEDVEFMESLKSKNPLNKIGVPDDLKGAILLLSSAASDYINGANIVIDGGWTIW